MSERHPHFSEPATGVPGRAGRYLSLTDIDPVEFVPGLAFRPVLGDGSLVNFVSFEAHTVAPMHVHCEEQFTIVLEGEFEFELDGEIRTMRPGDVALVPPWVPHGARTHDTTCREIDVFTPPRTTLIEHARRHGGRRPQDSPV